jgi:NitT/TauT family transport system permease protein
MKKNLLKKLFTPFEPIDARTLKTVGILQFTTIILVWLYGMPEKTMFPRLGEIISAWVELWNHGLCVHIIASLKLLTLATTIAIIIVSALAYLSTVPFFKPITRGLISLRYNPIVGFTLFFTIVTGGGRNLQIALLVIFMGLYFLTSLLSVVNKIQNEEQGQIDRRKAQGMNRWQILYHVVIKDNLDQLIDVIRQNISITLMMIVAVEAMDKSFGGLGAMLVDTTRGLNFPKVFAIQITILVIGILLDYALNFIFHLFPANKKR